MRPTFLKKFKKEVSKEQEHLNSRSTREKKELEEEVGRTDTLRDFNKTNFDKKKRVGRRGGTSRHIVRFGRTDLKPTFFYLYAPIYPNAALSGAQRWLRPVHPSKLDAWGLEWA
jgi:hypothetical protein